MGGGYFKRQKNGGVYLGEGKNGGSILRGRKKWGEYTLAAEGRTIMSTPPQGVFGTFPKRVVKYKVRFEKF